MQSFVQPRLVKVQATTVSAKHARTAVARTAVDNSFGKRLLAALLAALAAPNA
jgi:hypothetical protein